MKLLHYLSLDRLPGMGSDEFRLSLIRSDRGTIMFLSRQVERSHFAPPISNVPLRCMCSLLTSSGLAFHQILGKT